MTPFPTLMTPFPNIPFNNESEELNYGRIPPSCISLTHFPKIYFTDEEATGCINKEAIGAINEAAIGAIEVGRTPPFCCCFFSCFTISVGQSINRPEFSSDFTIQIISFISSFQMNKLNLFPVLMAPLRLIFLSNLSNIDEVALVANLGKAPLARRIGRFISASLPNLPITLPRNLSD